MFTFKQFINEDGYPADDYKGKKDPDAEVKGWDLRSAGEEDFKDDHEKKKKKKDHPIAPESQFDGGTGKDKSKSSSEIKSSDSGERTPNYQGTSKLPDKSGFGKSSRRSQDKEDGDKKTPRVDYNSYNYGIEEGIIDDLRKIAKKGKSEEITFKNGSTLEVDETSAKTIVDAHEDLSGGRQKKFEDLLEKGESSFMKALDFASSI